MFRRFLHKRSLFHPPNFSELHSISIGENTMWKLRSFKLRRDRLRLNGLTQATKQYVTMPPEMMMTAQVVDTEDLLKVTRMDMVKSRLRDMRKDWISYSEFVRICGETFADTERGFQLAKLLDERGNVIVFGNAVCIRPGQRKFISKQGQKHNAMPELYMREVISNLYRILKYATWESAQNKLEKLPIKWDSYTVNQVLKTHPPMEKAWLFFNWAARLRGFKHDQYTYTTMADIFGEAGRISSMYYIFKQMQEKGLKIDVVTYTSLMHWVSNSGDIDGAVKLWEEMRSNDCYPTVVSYTAYMKILLDNKRVNEATSVYKEMLQSGVCPNCQTYTVLMEYLVKAGKFDEAYDIFLNMQEAGVKPDKAACNILVEKCCDAEETKTITRILEYMKENNIVLRYPVFMKALEILNVSGESNDLLWDANPHIVVKSSDVDEVEECTKDPADDPLTLDKRLISILLQKKNLVAIDCILTGMIDRNVILDSSTVSNIIEDNCKCNRCGGALLAFEYSVKIGLKLERSAYIALIGTLIRSNTFRKVVEIVKELIDCGHSLGEYLSALLVYRLGCARRLPSAVKIFDLLPDVQKGTATYTSLMGVYFSFGRVDKGLKVYKKMTSIGIPPSLGTYNVLLAGLQKCGKLCEANEFKKEKKSFDTHHLSDVVPAEVKICDLLFAGNLTIYRQ